MFTLISAIGTRLGCTPGVANTDEFVSPTGVGNGSKLAIQKGPICVEIKKKIYIYIQDRILKCFLNCIVLY